MEAEQRTDWLTPALAARFAATFDRRVLATGQQGIHWCLATPEAPTAALGIDGHPLHLEYSGLPRRMWASSEVDFHAPIAVGAKIERVSHVAETQEKSGKSGRLLFVTVAHEVRADGLLAVSERQSIVYRPPGRADASPSPAPPHAETERWAWERTIVPQPPLLFRYSALTFNSHRIHYDLPYAREEEGYRGLVVHGPLMASLLLDLVDRQIGPDALARFAFRAVSPAFAGAPLRLLGQVEGRAVRLVVAGEDGRVVMTASAELRPA